MAQTILISAWRMPRHPDNEYIRGWAEPAWALLDQMEAIGFDEVARRMAAIARAPMRRRAPSDELLARRRRVLGSALESLSYRSPLHLVRGNGAWMEAADGRRYLDAYNNVPVVGHAHPRVVDAIARQAATLNTNTRYLHEHVVELAERLVATMPEGLDTVLFVNSGSEANDLAWRLATTATGADAGIATAWSYHGVTDAIADFSSSEWPRGEQPARVEAYPAPDTYRGRYADSSDPASVGRAEISEAVARLAERGRRPAALFVDSTFTSDGIFVPEPAVVSEIVAAAREAGALFVADEVQSGHGRTGELWGFTRWGVTPDIVTLGKPMGNGHPIAAVITRAEHRRPVRGANDVLLDVRRQPGRVRRGAGRPRRARRRAPHRERRERRRVAARAASSAGRAPPRDRRRSRPWTDDRRRARSGSRDARARGGRGGSREGCDG